MRPIFSAATPGTGFFPRVFLAAMLVSLAGCQYLQPRSVDDIEQGKLPAPIERSDTRDGILIEGSGPAGQSLMDEEEMRLARQREASAKSALLVLSAGATRASGLQAGSELTLEFEAQDGGKRHSLTLDIGCEKSVCAERRLKLRAHEVISKDLLTVTVLPEGRWKLHSARLKEVSALASGDESQVEFSRAPSFEVRNGYTTYLGSFTVVGGAQRIRRGSGKEIVRLPLVRFSNLEKDMERALTEFPETRGRRMLNEARGMARPQPVN
ncbi:MAG: hypothetical protein ACRBC3_15700 [Burkholderiaceae bacterium]